VGHDAPSLGRPLSFLIAPGNAHDPAGGRAHLATTPLTPPTAGRSSLRRKGPARLAGRARGSASLRAISGLPAARSAGKAARAHQAILKRPQLRSRDYASNGHRIRNGPHSSATYASRRSCQSTNRPANYRTREGRRAQSRCATRRRSGGVLRVEPIRSRIGLCVRSWQWTRHSRGLSPRAIFRCLVFIAPQPLAQALGPRRRERDATKRHLPHSPVKHSNNNQAARDFVDSYGPWRTKKINYSCLFSAIYANCSGAPSCWHHQTDVLLCARSS
jgi:hypothetical protein